MAPNVTKLPPFPGILSLPWSLGASSFVADEASADLPVGLTATPVELAVAR